MDQKLQLKLWMNLLFSEVTKNNTNKSTKKVLENAKSKKEKNESVSHRATMYSPRWNNDAPNFDIKIS